MSMRRFKLDIMLEEELVISARSATVGGNHSLDYIPGAALLGAVAARLYHTFQEPEQSYTLFHSGQVRFGNALPVNKRGERGRPIPLAWHIKKGVDIHTGDGTCLAGEDISNYCREERDPTVKRVQLRSGFITDSGYLLNPATRFRMKTAIDPDKGRAATAQLFGYQSLQAGQRFQSYVDIDDSVESSTAERLLETLAGTMQIGRSRSAQYGEVSCQLPDPAGSVPTKRDNSQDSGELVIWLQSDVALFNDFGQPVLLPAAKHFGLSGTRLDDKTFIRTRSYSPYNSKRRHYDSVREVLEQGSVITFKLDEPVTEQNLEDLARGIGAWREQGLGQVSLNHDLLTDKLPTPEPLPDWQKQEEKPGDSIPDHPLARWLQSHVSGGSDKQAIRRQAEQAAKELAGMYAAARRFAGQPEGVLIGPGTTQWGRIADLARKQLNVPTADALLSALFDPENKQAVCKPGDADWFAETGYSGVDSSFAGWLKNLLESHGDRAALLAVNLAQIARTVVKEKEGRI